MAIPGRLLPHSVVRVRPAAVVDPTYGTTWDYGAPAARSTFPAWLEQVDADERFDESRGVIEQRWSMLTNISDIDTNDRIEWAGHPAGAKVFAVDGPPEPAYTSRGPHHTESRLRIVEG